MSLKKLSDKATPGPWAWDRRGEKVNEWGLGTAFDKNEKQLSGRFDDEDAIYDEYVCSHEAATCNYSNPEFICALVNAYRAGELVERRAEGAERRCWTGNPCGTDTAPVGSECSVLGKCFWKLRAHVERSGGPADGHKP